jgi:hypothetical protein
MESDGQALRITPDLSWEFGPSSSSKTAIVAMTRGNVDVPNADGIKIGLNVCKK